MKKPAQQKFFRTRQGFFANKFTTAAALFAGAVLLLALGGLAALLSPAYAAPPEAVNLVQSALTQQQQVEKDIRAYYETGEFTFSAPLVIQNPYNTAALTALVIFDTPENVQISLHIPGKSPQTAVDTTFAGYRQHHEIPVYGLYPDTLNRVTLTMTTPDGHSAQSGLYLQTEALPVYLEQIQVDQLNPGQYSSGFNFILDKYKTVFDMEGTTRWYSTQESYQPFTPLQNGHYLFLYHVPNHTNQVLMEKDLLGKIYAVYYETDDIHHDIVELPDGNLLLTSEDSKSQTIQDQIIEIERDSGRIVRSFDLKEILDPSRPHEIGSPPEDWFHLNSMTYDPGDSSILISSKAQSAVIKLSYPEMKIQWILGSHDNWNAAFQPYLLTPIGKDFAWPWSQHHATLYSPRQNGSGVLDVLLFDNGLYRSFDPASAYSLGECYSRVVHYRIDETHKTVEEVWQYGKERGSDQLAIIRGSAYVLANGSVMGTWSDIIRDPEGNLTTRLDTGGSLKSKIIEVDPANNAVIAEYTRPDSSSYRVFRAGLYDRYSAEGPLLSAALNDVSAIDLQKRGILFDRDLRRWVVQTATILRTTAARLVRPLFR